MHGSLGSQPQRHDPMPSHQPMHQHQHHHRQELTPHHHQQQQQQPPPPQNVSQPRPVLLHSPNPFHHQQPMQNSPRPMTLRPQNQQQRNMPNRLRMVRNKHYFCLFSMGLSEARSHKVFTCPFFLECTNGEAYAATQQQPTGAPSRTWQRQHDQWLPCHWHTACCQGNSRAASRPEPSACSCRW